MSLPDAKKNHRILLLATKGVPTNIVYNALTSVSQNMEVIIEGKIGFQHLLKGRLKKLGFTLTLGQLAFQLIIPPLLKIFSAKRIAEIINIYKLNTSPIPNKKIRTINSVNSVLIIDLIEKIKPEIILLNGTRILSREIIEQITCPIINIHVGITPQYRGVHGGYWALFNNDVENFGVTIHHVDKGIDTGNIIKQVRITPDKRDNFTTYPILQYAFACKELPEIVQAIVQNGTEHYSNEFTPTKSKLWYHPTLSQYLFGKAK